jgi:hypothetical protein
VAPVFNTAILVTLRRHVIGQYLGQASIAPSFGAAGSVVTPSEHAEAVGA